MKLFEYRFDQEFRSYSKIISDTIQNFFISKGENEIIFIGGLNDGIRRITGCGHEVSHAAEVSFLNSYDSIVSNEVYFYIKSSQSCRFVSFEDNGLIRICMSADDNYDLFDEIDVYASDVSFILVSTDIYDFI